MGIARKTDIPQAPVHITKDNLQLQRSYTHDYREPYIYLLTVTVENRRPLLGQVCGDIYTAHIELTPLGEAVRYELYALCKRYPQLRLLQHQVMPDHVHVILQVTERLPKPLGSFLSSWKIACGHAYARVAGASTPTQNKDAGASACPRDKTAGASTDTRDKGKKFQTSVVPSSCSAALALNEKAPYLRLFAEGYNDRILQGKGQLQRMISYVRDNPRRLLLKHQCRPYFTIHRGVNVAGHTLDAVGNLALLHSPLMSVHCRRHWTEEEQQAYHNRCLAAAEDGTVLIGAFISKAEQAIAKTVLERQLPLIHLMENGFNDLYKPVGRDFYATAEGRLLQLAPWEYHARRKVISREQCNAMNTLAETIASQQDR